jgi:hypothetical protein
VRFAAVVAAAPLFVLAQVGVSDSGGSPGTVNGTVLQGESRTPVDGALVQVVGGIQSTTTDRLGRFELTDIPVGLQALTISGGNVQPMRVTDIKIDSGQQLTLSPIIATPVGASGPRREEIVVRAGAEVVTLCEWWSKAIGPDARAPCSRSRKPPTSSTSSPPTPSATFLIAMSPKPYRDCPA